MDVVFVASLWVKTRILFDEINSGNLELPLHDKLVSHLSMLSISLLFDELNNANL